VVQLRLADLSLLLSDLGAFVHLMGVIMDYKNQLKDRKWYNVRRNILERDHHKCRNCGDNESKLNVHHKYYLKGKKAWEYPFEALVTLCEFCHESLAHHTAPDFPEELGLTKTVVDEFVYETAYGNVHAQCFVVSSKKESAGE